MDAWDKAIEELLSGARDALEKLDRDQVSNLVNVLTKTRIQGKKVLVVGAGRSGLVGKAFAMRLMHLGFNVFVLGETITPGVGDGDLVLVISGSGKTALPVTVASMANKLDAYVIAVTSQPESPLGEIADSIVELPGRQKVYAEDEYHTRQISGQHESLAPLGTLFEVTAMIFLDSIVAELMTTFGATEEVMKSRHATIE